MHYVTYASLCAIVCLLYFCGSIFPTANSLSGGFPYFCGGSMATFCMSDFPSSALAGIKSLGTLQMIWPAACDVNKLLVGPSLVRSLGRPPGSEEL